MNDVYFYVVTADTFENFKKRFKKENGDLLFYALSVRDYENIALNMADIKRFIDQQQQIIVYYEDAVSTSKQKPEKEMFRLVSAMNANEEILASDYSNTIYFEIIGDNKNHYLRH